jgi:hypothetical protein
MRVKIVSCGHTWCNYKNKRIPTIEMDSVTPLPVMTDSGNFIHWQGRMYKQMKSRTAEAYSDAHRLRRKNYMRSYRAKKRAAVEKVTRGEGEGKDVSTVITTVTVS